jgi:EpsD family peptidyl-prolyl cis-trans isomerase
VYSTKWKRLLVAAGCALAVAACGKGGSGGKDQGPVVLKVNDKAYTTADLERELGQESRRAPREMQQYLASKEGQTQFLERLIRRELLLQEAEKQKMGERPEVAEQVAALRRDLMLRALLQEEIGAKVKVEDKEVQEYFTAHPEEFSGDQVRVRHILVRTEEEAKYVLDRVKKEPFEEVAKQVSLDTASASKGGDLDYLRREQMFPDFAKAAFALKPGEVSGAVRTPFGYHIIKMVDRKKGQPPTFEQVKEQLRQRLTDERQNQRYQEWMKSLEAAAKITRDESLLPVGKLTPPAPDVTGPGAEDGKSGTKM